MMIENPERIVAQLRLPARIDGIDKVVGGLESMYGSGLVIITDGPLWRDGWMVIARGPDAESPDSES